MTERPVAVLFDLDGTLIDSIDLILTSVERTFAGRDGRAPTRAEWTAGIGTPLREQLRPFVESPEEMEEIVERYRGHQRELHDRMTRCYDDVVDTLTTLHARGHPLGVVTSKMTELMQRSLSYVGLAPLMSVTVGYESAAKHKPDAEPVRVALEKLGYEPREAVFVGDSPHDMIAGRAAGVTTIAALWGPFTRVDLEHTRPDHWIERITQLPALLRDIHRGHPPANRP